jgi:regulator of replication initiation timing
MAGQVSDSKSTLLKKNILVIILSVILVAMVVLYFVQRSGYNEIVGQLITQKDSIKTELQHMMVENDSVKTDNEMLNQNLAVTQKRIKDLLNEVEQVKKVSYQEITNYQNQVNTLRGIMRDLYAQIDSLNERNKVLFAENVEVKQRFNEERDKNQELEKEKQKLEQTVKKAQMLEALQLKATGLTPRDNETVKVAKAQKLMVSFTLSKNLTAKRGSKNIYIRILRPDQLLLIESEKNVFQFENMKIPYSAVREVNYEGNELPVNIFWDNAGKTPLIAGTYTIDVFADEHNIGTTTLVMRQ